MKEASLYDFTTKTSRVVYVPDGCSALAPTMEHLVVCPSCHVDIAFGKTYCSRRWFTKDGLWSLSVCPECHERELDEEFKSMREGEDDG